MLVKEWMGNVVQTIEAKASLNEAIKLFQTRMISLLPVVKGKKIIGIISDGDIKKASPSDATTLDKFEMLTLLDTVAIESIMSRPVITISADHTIAEAAKVMLNNSISGLPVVDKTGKMEGIITKSDIFRGYVSFTGLAEKGQVFAFRLQDRPGVIKNLTDMIRKGGGRLSSIMTSYDPLEPDIRKVFIHAFDLDRENFDSLSTKFYLAGELYYAADVSRGFRKLYQPHSAVETPVQGVSLKVEREKRIVF